MVAATISGAGTPVILECPGDKSGELEGTVSMTVREQETTWMNTRVFRDVGKAVVTLKAEPERRISALNRVTLITARCRRLSIGGATGEHW
jgi:hypothetical protein